jgi:hypothetical protein
LKSTTAVATVVEPVSNRIDGKIDDKVDLPDSWWRQKTHVAAWLLVVAITIFFVRYAAEVIVPLVLSALMFYALDPAVDLLQRYRVPRWLGALLILGAVIGGAGAGVYALRGEDRRRTTRRRQAAARAVGIDRASLDDGIVAPRNRGDRPHRR